MNFNNENVFRIASIDEPDEYDFPVHNDFISTKTQKHDKIIHQTQQEEIDDEYSNGDDFDQIIQASQAPWVAMPTNKAEATKQKIPGVDDYALETDYEFDPVNPTNVLHMTEPELLDDPTQRNVPPTFYYKPKVESAEAIKERKTPPVRIAPPVPEVLTEQSVIALPDNDVSFQKKKNLSLSDDYSIPWYQQNWFYMLVGIVIIVVIFFVYRYMSKNKPSGTSLPSSSSSSSSSSDSTAPAAAGAPTTDAPSTRVVARVINTVPLQVGKPKSTTS